MGSTLENKVSLEEQFILRLPLEEATKIREILLQKPNKLKKNLKISFDAEGNKLILDIADAKLYGTLKKLPTILESYKTNVCDRKSTLFKVADLCHIVSCIYEENLTDKTETIHGYCPPLKNAKKKRFRKTMYNENTALEAETVSKELYYLLSTDLEAISSRFEILYEGNPDHQKPPEQSETWLFGQLSSDSELSENSS